MPPRSSLLAALFVGSLVLWTIGLLVPLPNAAAKRVLGSDQAVFTLHKLIHVGSYAYLTILAGHLTLSTWQRWAILGLLSLHGFATEYLQQFVERGASWFDVGIDHVGILVGLMISWNCWRILWRPAAREISCPQKNS